MITKVVGKQKVLGTGKPDFSKNVSSALERAGLRLKAKQQLKMYGRNRTPADPAYLGGVVSSPLAPGASVHLCDAETLVDMPITIPVGYTMSVITMGHTVDQDARLIAFLDGLLAYCFALVEGGSKHYHNEVLGLSTLLYDADASDSHTLDIKLFNIGTVDLYGSISVVCIREALGTSPLPTIKECQCPYCAHKQVESVHATRIKCNNCGKEYLVMDLTNFRETP